MRRCSEYFVVSIILIQTLLVITINNEIITIDNLAGLKQVIPFINLIIFGMCIISLIAIQSVGKYREHRFKALLMKNHLVQIEQLIITLQSERHEYARHLQAMQSLMELGRLDEAIAYMDSITEGPSSQYEMHYIDHPALSALLNAKKIAAEKQGIDVAIAVKCELSDLDIPPADFCSIVGNLLDNALEAATQDSRPRVGIEFIQEHGFITLYISNNGATIPQGVDIFEAGFSTKTPETCGYGLYVVRRLLDKYHGQIEMSSNKSTGIWVKLPIKEINHNEKHVQKISPGVGNFIEF